VAALLTDLEYWVHLRKAVDCTGSSVGEGVVKSLRGCVRPHRGFVCGEVSHASIGSRNAIQDTIVEDSENSLLEYHTNMYYVSMYIYTTLCTTDISHQ
jgi:hypothetical protein